MELPDDGDEDGEPGVEGAGVDGVAGCGAGAARRDGAGEGSSTWACSGPRRSRLLVTRRGKRLIGNEWTGLCFLELASLEDAFFGHLDFKDKLLPFLQIGGVELLGNQDRDHVRGPV